MQERLSEPPYNSSTGTVILLQEVSDPGAREGYFRNNCDSSALAGILADEWVRSDFLTADTRMMATYGTVTLISKNLATVPAQRNTNVKDNGSRGCFRVPAPASVMGRDLLCVDLILQRSGILRICNVHLESLTMGTKTRPLQLALASQLLREEGVAAGIVAGDMNAIDTQDFTLPSREDIELQDFWAEYIGRETALAADSEKIGWKEESSENSGNESNWGEEKGHTWGYQSGNTIYNPRRLDKILFRVNKDAKAWLEPVEGAKVDRLGVNLDVKIDLEQPPEEGSNPQEDYYEGISKEEKDEPLWVSDHFGLMTRFNVVTGE
ncbi:hypothetical protein BGX38DRAFT_1267985 [Terfezia claveryi]|nr:hypothetical protein BGX38DRAFT_1267985 [Terfezia claveryi]